MENNVKIKGLPYRDYVRDNLYLEKYGKFDKSILQSKTIESVIRFLIKGLSIAKKETKKKDTEEWINDSYQLIKYWDQCTTLAKKRRHLSRKKDQRKGRQR